jgi:hypothetical protein
MQRCFNYWLSRSALLMPEDFKGYVEAWKRVAGAVLSDSVDGV